MKKLATTLFAPTVLLILSGVLASAVVPASRPGSAQGQNSAPDANAQRVSGIQSFDLPDSVTVSVKVSLLQPATGSAGSAVRAVLVQARFLRGWTYIGESLYHEMLPVSSAQTVDMSIKGLDLNLADDSGPNHVDLLRSYKVHVVPAAGRSWGSLTSFDHDLVIQASVME